LFSLKRYRAKASLPNSLSTNWGYIHKLSEKDFIYEGRLCKVIFGLGLQARYKIEYRKYLMDKDFKILAFISKLNKCDGVK